MNSMTTLNQRLANIFAFAKIASIMFAMNSRLTRRPDQLKMPWQDAYYIQNNGPVEVRKMNNKTPDQRSRVLVILA